jgi:putative ATP-dependent endonuclease of OLD family
MVDALTITAMGSKVGRWMVDVLGTPGFELTQRIAALRDTDHREAGAAYVPPAWIDEFDPEMFQAFHSQPTFEPTLVPGNEALLEAALGDLNIATPAAGITPESIDNLFRTTASDRKAELALALADRVRRATDEGGMVAVPHQISDLFDFVMSSPDEAEDAAEEPADA